MGILSNLLEVIKGLKHRNSSPKFCPRCSSPKMRLSSLYDIWLTPEQYLCEDCGYKGPIYMELEKKDE